MLPVGWERADDNTMPCLSGGIIPSVCGASSRTASASMSLNSVVESVTANIIERSKVSRRRYLALMERNRAKGVSRPQLTCANMAHAVAAAASDKNSLMHPKSMNIGIIST